MKDLVSLRGSCRYFRNIITPILFQRDLKINFEPPVGHSRCKLHGWSRKAKGNDRRLCNGRYLCLAAGDRIRQLLVRGEILHGDCGVFSHTDGPLMMPLRGRLTLQRHEHISFVDPTNVHGLLNLFNSPHMTAFRYTKKLSLDWWHIHRSSQERKFQKISASAVVSFAKHVLPVILAAMDNLEVLEMQVGSRSTTLVPKCLPAYLRAFCEASSAVQDLDVRLYVILGKVHLDEQFRKDCFDGLSGLSSFMAVFHACGEAESGFAGLKREMEGYLPKLLRRCPKIQVNARDITVEAIWRWGYFHAGENGEDFDRFSVMECWDWALQEDLSRITSEADEAMFYSEGGH